jgi:lysophospholipase L1-like esterase
MRICIFGDSVTYGGYVKSNWVNLLRWHLEDTLDEDVEVFNLGINGNTSKDILLRLEGEALPRKPDKLIFAFGINDSGYIYSTNMPLVNEEIFKENINSILQIAKRITSDITFVGLTLGDDSILKPLPESSSGKSYDRKRANQYNDILKNLVQQQDCTYIELLNTLGPDDFLDGLHPNENGHKKIFEKLTRNTLTR